MEGENIYMEGEDLLMCKGTSTIDWETIQTENDGKLSVQISDGGSNGKDKLSLEKAADARVTVKGVDGKVKSVLDWVKLVDPNDLTVKDIANAAVKTNNKLVEMEGVNVGIKVSVVLGAVYGLVISATDRNGDSQQYFAVVFNSVCSKIVLFLIAL